MLQRSKSFKEAHPSVAFNFSELTPSLIESLLFAFVDSQENQLFTKDKRVYFGGEVFLERFSQVPRDTYDWENNRIFFKKEPLSFLGDYSTLFFMHHLLVRTIFEALSTQLDSLVSSFIGNKPIPEGDSFFVFTCSQHSFAEAVLDVPVLVRKELIQDRTQSFLYLAKDGLVDITLNRFLAIYSDVLEFSEKDSLRYYGAFSQTVRKENYPFVFILLENLARNRIKFHELYSQIPVALKPFSLESFINWVIIELAQTAVTSNLTEVQASFDNPRADIPMEEDTLFFRFLLASEGQPSSLPYFSDFFLNPKKFGHLVMLTVSKLALKNSLEDFLDFSTPTNADYLRDFF